MARFMTTAVNSLGNHVDIGGRGKGAGEVHLRGWDAGVKVIPVGVKGKPDRFEIYMTLGSHASGGDVRIGTVYDTQIGPQFRAAFDHDELAEES